MKIRWTKYVVILSSVILISFGLSAFFIPDQLHSFARNTTQGNKLWIQLLGAALLGFGFANWHNRHSPIGGIYGRALVTGNLIHFLAGTGLLLGLVLGGQRSTGILIISFIYLLLAVGYIAILFRGGIMGDGSKS